MDAQDRAELAADEGIPALTLDHWKVIDFAERRLATGKSPTLVPDHNRGGCGHQAVVRPLPQRPGQEGRPHSGLGKPEGA
ncbi:MAG: hypothetical protein KIS63_02035 [Caldilineales bacterium]|nr:hypothetical protein [Caldilineales bacterium]